MAKILVVDDDRQVAETLSAMLEDAGHNVQMAVNGAEALQMAHDNMPDLVITDILMPVMEGIETIRVLQSRSSVPIVAMSGGGRIPSADLLAMAENLGASSILQKPVTRKILLDVVAKHLASDTQ